ncbi:MAG: hypothetical protein WC708_09325, partial [Lentisphaeria bacterium]
MPASLKPLTIQSDAGGWRVRLARGWLAALVLLAPLKFGSVMVTGEVAFFPLSGWEWLLGGWPPVLAPAAAAVGLLLAVLAVPPPARPWCGSGVASPAVWGGLLLLSLAGLFRTTEADAAFLMVLHGVGIVCFVAAVWWLRAGDSGFDPWFWAA